ncbi:uncharacterized protein ARMOST_02934 [Armillaria ostoyae]|uniref:Uncharacterized protein n=1 Tax=Armillaria ostoyae TaxID=47428 RepID=A0A284QT30_ARMOS|nr:uncharacterized protein ARMOST_02934 [Armillaria ostoyae]
MAQSMPGLNEKSAPRFEKSTDPEELERFFARLEELFNKYAIALDLDKKKYAVIYTDIKTEKHWKVLDHFELKQLIWRYRLSPIQEKSEYMSFKREFQVLVVVLKKEGMCSNQELVNQFLAPMADSLYNLMKLRMEQLNAPVGKTSRDPANPYTLEEVMASGLDVLQVKQEDMGGILVSIKDIFEQQQIAALEKAFIKQQKTITSFLQQQQQQYNSTYGCYFDT